MPRSRLLLTLLLAACGLSGLVGAATGQSKFKTGTGFAISGKGHIITNEHVVSSCSSIRVVADGRITPATLQASDWAVDLALLKVDQVTLDYAQLRSNPPVRLGEEAITFGFPLVGALTVDGNLTTGHISGLRGLGDSADMIQITTPVQPGNSGGALLDKSANVIGVVASKLDALRVLRATGDVPQNVNFAVSLGALRQFLAHAGLTSDAASSISQLNTADVGDRARKFTYLIACESEAAPATPPGRDKTATVQTPPVGETLVNVRQLRFSDVKQLYPTISPEDWQFVISNFGQDRISEVTIGFRTAAPGWACTRNLQDYDGLKKFNVNLSPRDAVTVSGKFSGRATGFCIVSARAADAAVVEAIRIIEFGIYTAQQGAHEHHYTGYTLLTQTDRIPLKKGLMFGTKYLVQGTPNGRPITLTWVTRFPKKGLTNPQGVTTTHQESPWGATIGTPNWRSYTFGRDWELVPGEWVFEFHYQGRKLAEKRFMVVEQ